MNGDQLCIINIKNELGCTTCLDVIRDIDSWITSDTTEQEIEDLLKNVSSFEKSLG